MGLSLRFVHACLSVCRFASMCCDQDKKCKPATLCDAIGLWVCLLVGSVLFA